MLRRIPRWADSNVLVGFDTSDDAGVYKLTPECALVQTVDFFTPIVDDPYTFGAIAAANSLSDVYAMGGRPISSLSILAYPAKGDLDTLEGIIRGGADKMREADCSILGGHSIADEEIKFGYAVTGTIHPERVKTNAGARAGDALVLTKRIGTGVISTALKRGIARESDVEASIESMVQLNRDACETMLRFDVHGVTDITGFGLIGHATEMARASGVTIAIDAGTVPLFDGVLKIARRNQSGGMGSNRDHFAPGVTVEPGVDADLESLLYDPQTSGGLLIASSAGAAEQVADRLREAGVAARLIGIATAPRAGVSIIVRP